MPAAAVAAVGTIAASAIAAGASGSEVTGFTLPPEFEIQLVNTAQQNLGEIQKEFERVSQLESDFNERVDTIQGIVEGTIPSVEGLQSLTDNSLRLAQNLGQSAEELLSNGFLTEADTEDLNRLRELEAQDFEDPRLNNQIADQRARLQQDLARQNVSFAGQAQSLAQFDRSAEEAKFSRAEQLRTGQAGRISQTIGLRSGLRQQGFDQTNASLQALQGQLGFAREGAGALGQVAQGRLQAGQQGLQNRQGIRGEQLGTFQELGKFLLSNRSQDIIRRGGTNTPTLGEQGITGQTGGGATQARPNPRVLERSAVFSKLTDEQLQGQFEQLQGSSSAPSQGSNAALQAATQELTKRGLL